MLFGFKRTRTEYSKGRIVIINSTVNAALLGFTKAASKYLGNHGICLNVVNPWITESESWQNTATNFAKSLNTTLELLNDNFKKMNPLKRFTDVDDIGQTIAFLLSENANYINGASINLDGGHQSVINLLLIEY